MAEITCPAFFFRWSSLEELSTPDPNLLLAEMDNVQPDEQSQCQGFSSENGLRNPVSEK